MNVRRPEDDRVYSVALATHEFPVDSGAWLDKSPLAAKDIETISGPNYTLKKVNDNWELVGDKGGDMIKAAPDKARKLTAGLSELRILSVADGDLA